MELALSQAELAKQIGLDQKTVERIEAAEWDRMKDISDVIQENQ